jgi:hypothetical protein
VLELVEALNSIASRHGAIILTLVGLKEYSDASYIERIRQAFREAPENVLLKFAFDATKKEVAQTIRASDILVLPSLHEGFGMPVAEALIAGTPVVCSDGGALPEVSRGLALTFPHGDFEQLTKRLDEALTARRTGKVLSDRGEFPESEWREFARSEAERFSLISFKTRWKEAISNMMERYERSHSDYRKSSLTAFRSLIPSRAHSTVRNIDAQLLGRIYGLKVTKAASISLNDGVQALHSWCFGREALPDEAAYWRSVAEGKLSNIAMKLAKSNEVRSDFVRFQLAAGILESISEFDEVETNNALVGAGAVSTATFDELFHLLRTIESNTKFIAEIYRALLLRSAAPDEIAFWQDAMTKEKKSREDVYRAFLVSDEFRSRVGDNFNGYKDVTEEQILTRVADLLNHEADVEDFINASYLALLCREVESEGLEAWQQHLAEGKSRRYVISQILSSSVFSAVWPNLKQVFLCAALSGDLVSFSPNMQDEPAAA